MRVDWCVSSWFRIKNTHSHADHGLRPISQRAGPGRAVLWRPGEGSKWCGKWSAEKCVCVGDDSCLGGGRDRPATPSGRRRAWGRCAQGWGARAGAGGRRGAKHTGR